MTARPDLRYRTVAAPVETEIEVKRSRFRCHLAPVGDEAAARAAVDARRREHWEAGHHCVAFVLGPRREVERSSDDGEPAGTAGAPMLEALRGADLTDVVAVVTRWFGGTLLGTGGLVRAYGDAVRQAVASASIATMRLVEELTVTVDPAIAGRVESELRRRGVEVLSARWAAQVELVVGITPAERDAVLADVASLTSGTATARRTGERWARLTDR